MCAFEHRLLQHGADRRIVAAKQGAQMPPEPFMRKSRLRNYSLGARAQELAGSIFGMRLPTYAGRLPSRLEELMPDPAPIDCDLHPTVPAMSALMPYLDDMWRETVLRRGIDELNTISYRPTVRSPRGLTGAMHAANPPPQRNGLGKEALDPFGTRIAILNCLYGVQATFSEDLGAAMARAVNDWIVREWLDRDPRLRASIVVPQQNAELAVAEIERCAGTAALCRCCCWYPANCRWDGGRTGRSMPPRSAMA